MKNPEAQIGTPDQVFLCPRLRQAATALPFYGVTTLLNRDGSA